MIDRWTDKDCDRCGIRFQFTRTEPRPRQDEYVCPECAAYERGAKECDAELESVKAELAKAQAERDHFRVQLRGAQERGVEAEIRAEKAVAELEFYRERDEFLRVYRDLVTRAAEAEARISTADAEKEELRRALSLAHLLLGNWRGTDD